jgi:hypothetical protein
MHRIAILIAAGALALPAAASSHKTHHRAHAAGAARAACKAERDSLGVTAFRAKYANEKGHNAMRRCVRAHRRAAIATCKAERTSLGVTAFRAKYGTEGGRHRHAFRRCVRAHAGDTVSS